MSIMLHRSGIMSASLSTLHPMTLDYIARLQAVDGHEPAFDEANDYLIRELVTLGGAYWDTMGTMTALAGKKWEGLLIPLRDGMDVGTNYNFESGDFNANTGLIGDEATKYIDANRNNNTDPQNNFAMGVIVTDNSANTAGTVHIAGGMRSVSGSSYIYRASHLHFGVRSSGDQIFAFGQSSTGYIGASRADGSSIDIRRGSTTENRSQGSQARHNETISVFRSNNDSAALPSENPNGYSASRIMLYHIGPAIDLTTIADILNEYRTRIEAVTL